MNDWLKAFLEKETWEVVRLHQAGEEKLADAQNALLSRLRAAEAQASGETVTVDEAARLTGVNPETARRAVRRGELTDLRVTNRQVIRILKNELPLLATKLRKRNPESPIP